MPREQRRKSLALAHVTLTEVVGAVLEARACPRHFFSRFATVVKFATVFKKSPLQMSFNDLEVV